MNKRITSIILTTFVLVIATCFQFGSPPPIQATVTSPVQDGDSDSADFLIWQRTIGIAAGQMVRLTVANLSTDRKARPLNFQCSVFDQNGSLVFQSARQEVLPGQFRHQNILQTDLPSLPFEVKRIDLLVTGFQNSGSKTPQVVTALELVDMATGKTTIYHPLLAAEAIAR